MNKQALRANVTFRSTLELDPDAISGTSISSFLEYLKGFRGPGLPLSAEKVAIASLHNQGKVVLSASSAEDNRLCCEFAPSNVHQ